MCKNNIKLFLSIGLLLMASYACAEQEVPERLTVYSPFYWIEGVKNNYHLSDTKVSFGMKYQMLEDANFYAVYSQHLFWDRKQDSSPFRDINHNPELFYRWQVNSYRLNYIDFGIFEHMSNGRDGDNSRSIDRRYIRFRSNIWERMNRFTKVTENVSATLKLFSYMEGTMGDNPDYDDYTGNWKFRLAINRVINILALEDTEFYIEYFAGRTSNIIDYYKGATEIGFIFNLKFWGMNPRFYIQAYNGYAENMLEYYELQHAVRVGVMML
jgi:phospholipase A1/A2